jgi:hypothetical protein
MAIATLAIHQDRRWFMGIVHLKGHARPRARRRGAPPPPLRRWHIKPAALALLPRPTGVQPRAYTCICMYMHGHGQAYGRRKRPRRPGSRMCVHMRRAGSPPPPPPRCPGKGTGPGRKPGSSSRYWFWNWVKQKKSPVGLRSTCTCCCCCLLRGGLRVGSFRVNEGSCSPLCRRHMIRVQGNDALDGLRRLLSSYERQ